MKNKILIVDDQEINRDILAGILHEDYELVLATNGVEAVEALGEDGNGIALVHILRQMYSYMSGKCQEGEKRFEGVETIVDEKRENHSFSCTKLP